MAVAEDRWLPKVAVTQAGGADSTSARQQFGAFTFSNAHILAGGLDLLLVDLWSHIVLLVDPRTYFESFCARNQLVGKLVVYALFDDHAAGRGAPLAGGTESCPDGPVNGKIDIGIIQDDDCILAAHLQRAGLEMSCGSLTNDASHLAGAGEGNCPDFRMFEHRRPGFRPVPMDNVDYSRRQAGIDERSNQIDSRERSVFCRLNYAGVPGDNRGKDLPGRNRHRKVPWRDHAHNPERHPDGHGKLIRKFRRDGVAVKPPSFSRHVERCINRFLHVAASFFEDLAHLAGHVARVIFLPLLKELTAAIKNFRAPRGWSQSPALEGFFGGFHGRVHVFLLGARKNSNHVLSIGRIEVFEGLAGAGFDPFARYEVLQDFRCHLAGNSSEGMQTNHRTVCGCKLNSERPVPCPMAFPCHAVRGRDNGPALLEIPQNSLLRKITGNFAGNFSAEGLETSISAQNSQNLCRSRELAGNFANLK